MVGKDARRWTAEHRAEFLRALARTGTVKGACAAIGKSVAGAHGVRQREPDFADAWDHVLGRSRTAWVEARDVVIHVPATGALAGYRVRHDGWTPARQKLFLTTLSQTGCVRDACARAVISDTSAYRMRRRSKRFAVAWDRALRKALPTIEGEAWRRAVEGWDETVIRGGEVVLVKRRYSDSLLRTLLMRVDGVTGAGRGAGGRDADPYADLYLKRQPGEREQEWLERRAQAAAKAAGGFFSTPASMEETNASLIKKLAMLRKTMAYESFNAEEAAWRAERAAEARITGREGYPPDRPLRITGF